MLFPRLTLLSLVFLLSSCSGEPVADAVDVNALVLEAVREMPSGGGYNTSKATDAIRQKAVSFPGDELIVRPEMAKPSYCSGGTYLAFLKVVQKLRDRGQLSLSRAALKKLAIADAKDGVNVWGRWNANGPGTAKLFADLECGRNFTSLEQARPGDFLKIWWTEEIGRRERGHSVIYLGQGTAASGEREIYYWSSNDPDGYGRGSARLSVCKHLLFSRLTNPGRLEAVTALSNRDDTLAAMLRQDFTWAQVLRMSKAR